MSDVFARMEREGYRFDFYQASRLLEQKFPGRTRFRPDASLAFPPSDVRRIQFEDDPPGRVLMTLSFMGLYGVDAAVPDFIPEKALDRGSGELLRDFLDIFNHRLYEFLFRGWRRMRPEVDEAERNERRFFALAGLSGSPSDPVSASLPREILALAGIMAPRSRGASGLRTLLSELFTLPVRIEENVPRWVRLGRRTGLGRGLRLGGSAVLGERVFDVSGKFRIWLGPMDLNRYESLLPGGEQQEALEGLVAAYVPAKLDYDVALQLHTEQMPRAKLADRSSRLGLTACLGRPREPVITRIVPGGGMAPRRYRARTPRAA